MITFEKTDSYDCVAPGHVLGGDGVSARIAEMMPKWHLLGDRVLIVADKQVAQLNLVHGVQEPLVASGYKVECFDNISGEPNLKTVEDLIAFARSAPFDVVIGLGGGSSMDMAKIVGIMANNLGQITEHLGLTSFEKPSLPTILMPTTAGTGSEATAVSMFSIDDKKAAVVSNQLVPFAAVLDAELTRTLPNHITAATGMDALSHALEGFMSSNANPFTDMQALAAVTTIAKWLKVACREGSNMEARRAMLYAAYSGGLALNAGVVLGHSAAYTIANRTHLSHGASCAMALPYTLAYNHKGCSARLDAMARVALGNSEATAVDLITWIAGLIKDLELPLSMKEVGVGESDLNEMAVECLERYPRPSNPVVLDGQRLKVFYEAMLAGDTQQAVENFCCT